jgi:nicotinamidase-related amidase
VNPALLVIDLQRWFLETGAPEKRAQVPALIAQCNALIDLFHERGLPVVHIGTAHLADGSTRNLWTKRHDRWTLMEGSQDVEAYPGVHRLEADLVVTKTRTSAFLRTELESVLRGLQVDAVVLAGYSTNLCVGLTAIDAYERDFDVLLAGEAILGTQASRGELMLVYLRDQFAIEPLPQEEIMERVGGA